MYKLLLMFLFFCLSSAFAFGDTVLNGGVSYSVSEARTIAFEDISFDLPAEAFIPYLKDNKKLKFRYVKTIFSNGNYALEDKKTHNCYYYTNNGDLFLIQIYVSKNNGIKRYARYDINGKLDSVTLSVKRNEQFIFDVNKKLQAHWIGKNCYDVHGELIQTRTGD